MGDGRGANRAEGSGSAEGQQAKVRLRSQGVWALDGRLETLGGFAGGAAVGASTRERAVGCGLVVAGSSSH